MAQQEPQRITPVILSGGAGTRLWPVSRENRPKQFLSFTGGAPMLRLTLGRVTDPARFDPPIIVASSRHRTLLEEMCGQDAGARFILEPVGRNTAPAIALAAIEAGPDAILLVMPSDHVIADEPGFHRAIAAAMPLARAGWLLTFGITPAGPETGYGYIRQGEAIADGVFRVEHFVEKPAADVARAYLEEGGYCWNAGIFLFRADAYLAALGEFGPAMLGASDGAMSIARRDGAFVLPDPALFAASPSDSIDYAVMEKADRVAVVPVAMGWSDIGGWDALYELLDKDAHGNAHLGDVLSLDSSGCLVRSDGPLVTLSGVQDLIVIATPDAVMILPRGSGQDTRKIIDALKADDHPLLRS